MAPELTIEQLTEAVALAFDQLDVSQSSGRVKEVPDTRTIRYYTTLGLLDRALRFRGRTAYYGRRHLLQLLAIKRLQAENRPLKDIQTRLHGATDAQLEAWARLPASFWPQLLARFEAAIEAPQSGTAGEARFWEQLPQTDDLGDSDETEETVLDLRPAVHLPIAPRVTLVLEGVRGGHRDREALGRLAREVREVVRRSGLVPHMPADD